MFTQEMATELQDLRQRHQKATGLTNALTTLSGTLTNDDPIYNMCSYKLGKYTTERDDLAPRLRELELILIRAQLEEGLI